MMILIYYDNRFILHNRYSLCLCSLFAMACYSHSILKIIFEGSMEYLLLTHKTVLGFAALISLILIHGVLLL
jgi:hypothetical protein